MSLAKLEVTQHSRKAWVCGKCNNEIPVGEKVIHFAVGYRGYRQHRCGRSECFPKPSERESSIVSEVYAAQEQADPMTALSGEELDNMVEDIASTCDEIASQYEENPTYEGNYDLQERAEQVRSAGEALQDWRSSVDDEPDEEGDPDAYQSWLDEARSTVQSMIDEMELP